MKQTTEKQIEAILNGVLINACGLKLGSHRTRTHDDHEGTFEGKVGVYIGPDGDAYLTSDQQPPLRFRNYFGGGRSPRVYNALLILAKAIDMDNAERPEQAPNNLTNTQ